MNHTITIPILVKMMLSIASGLCHLHLPIDSTNGNFENNDDKRFIHFDFL